MATTRLEPQEAAARTLLGPSPSPQQKRRKAEWAVYPYLEEITRSKLHFPFLCEWRNAHLFSCALRNCRHDEIKNMLDSSKDNLKLEAMKILIGVSLFSQRLNGGWGETEISAI